MIQSSWCQTVSPRGTLTTIRESGNLCAQHVGGLQEDWLIASWSLMWLYFWMLALAEVPQIHAHWETRHKRCPKKWAMTDYNLPEVLERKAALQRHKHQYPQHFVEMHLYCWKSLFRGSCKFHSTSWSTSSRGWTWKFVASVTSVHGRVQQTQGKKSGNRRLCSKRKNQDLLEWNPGRSGAKKLGRKNEAQDESGRVEGVTRQEASRRASHTNAGALCTSCRAAVIPEG